MLTELLIGVGLVGINGILYDIIVRLDGHGTLLLPRARGVVVVPRVLVRDIGGRGVIGGFVLAVCGGGVGHFESGDRSEK